MQEVFSGEPLRAVEQLRNTEVIPPALLADYQKLLSSTPARRLNPAQARRRRRLSHRAGPACRAAERNHSLQPPAERTRPLTNDPHPQVAECKFLNNRLVKVVAFMENISGAQGGGSGCWQPCMQLG